MGSFRRPAQRLRLHSFPTRRSSDLTIFKLHLLGSGAGGQPNANRFRQQQSVSRSHRSEEHTSELQSRRDLVCRLLLEKKKTRSPSSSPTTASSPTTTTHGYSPPTCA